MAQRTADLETAVPRARRKRADVVREAARLFSERGYHGTSMQHLAEAMGLLRGSLYAHIGSKEELLLEVVDEGAGAFLERARRAQALAAPAARRLEALLVGHIETASQHLDAATVFLNEWRYLGEAPRAAVQAKRDSYEQIVRDIILDGIGSGDFRPGLDVALAARLVLSAANWTYSWYRPGGDLSPTEIGKAFASMLVDGFKSEGNETNVLSKGEVR